MKTSLLSNWRTRLRSGTYPIKANRQIAQAKYWAQRRSADLRRIL